MRGRDLAILMQQYLMNQNILKRIVGAKSCTDIKEKGDQGESTGCHSQEVTVHL